MAWGIHRWKMSLLSLVVALIAGLASTTPVVAEAGLPALPLSTDGNEIVDSKGRTVVLQGVNWFGFETANHVPHGLWSRDYRDMLRQIKREGFNTIRLPFSLEAVRSADTSGIDYANGRNAALRGKTPLEVMDILVAEAGRQVT